MNDKKDFNYEAQKPVIVNSDPTPTPAGMNQEEYEITDVLFLTPAKVQGKWNGKTSEEVLNIDIVNRKAYDKHGICSYSDKIFEYLDRVNSLPEDFFEASEDIYEKANKAVDEMEDIRKSTLQGEE